MKENSSKQFNNFKAANSQSLSGSVDKSSTQEHMLKQQLFDQMKKSGVLDSLKSQLRGRLYEQLKIKNEKGTDFEMKSINNRLSYKLAISLISDLMKKCDMPYALSVFLPECGMSSEVLTKEEMVEVFALQHDDHIKTMGETTPLILDIVD